MPGYSKLFSTIITSTVWAESNPTRITWITMLALCDAGGFVAASVPGLAHAARVTDDECREALAKLSAPDPESRTKDHEGRRIEAVPGGWRILNYLAYREARNEDERRRQNAEAQKRWRERRKQDRKQVSQNKPSSAKISPCSNASAFEEGNDVLDHGGIERGKDAVDGASAPGAGETASDGPPANGIQAPAQIPETRSDFMAAICLACRWDRWCLGPAEQSELRTFTDALIAKSGASCDEIRRRGSIWIRRHPDESPRPAALVADWELSQ